MIRSLPEGVDTHVAEWGATLSGGQQQRLSLARALMRDAPVTLLDEVTSNLDTDTEDLLMPELLSYLQGRTVVIEGDLTGARQTTATDAVAVGRGVERRTRE